LADEQQQGEQQAAPNEQEVMAQLQEELRRLKVSDVLVQTVLTVSSLGFHKLEGEARDLDQARLAVEALRALVPTLQGVVPEEAIRDFNQMVANLQLAYAKAVSQATQAKPEAAAPAADGPPAATEAQSEPDAPGEEPAPETY
jgi:hypothetical protein